MTFSKRHGYAAPEPPITVREDAPEGLRFAVSALARDAGMSPSAIRSVICQVLFIPPDRNNWSEYPNIWEEVQQLLEQCDWFKVYDIVEAIYRSMEYRPEEQDRFRDELNRYFREAGVGWELKNEEGIVFRGEAAFQLVTSEAPKVLFEANCSNAANEIHEAMKDISRRPTPDRTGAIQHAMAALESTARDFVGEPNPTLGQLVSRLGLPKPLDDAVTKLWGFSSERGRHIREGDSVSDNEAELVVSVCCAVCIFLSKTKSGVA